MSVLGLAACSGDADPVVVAAPTTAATATAVGSGPALEVQVTEGRAEDSEVGSSGGSPVWVVVAGGATDPYDPILAGSVQEIEAFGYEGRISNCDRGAAEAIGMAADSTFTVTASFESQDAATDAVAVLAANQIDVVVAEVVVSCPN